MPDELKDELFDGQVKGFREALNDAESSARIRRVVTADGRLGELTERTAERIYTWFKTASRTFQSSRQQNDS